MAEDAAAGRSEASKADGLVDRKLVKQTVMTYVYGVTIIGAREQMESRLEERAWGSQRERRKVRRKLGSAVLAPRCTGPWSLCGMGAAYRSLWCGVLSMSSTDAWGVVGWAGLDWISQGRVQRMGLAARCTNRHVPGMLLVCPCKIQTERTHFAFPDARSCGHHMGRW